MRFKLLLISMLLVHFIAPASQPIEGLTRPLGEGIGVAPSRPAIEGQNFLRPRGVAPDWTPTEAQMAPGKLPGATDLRFNGCVINNPKDNNGKAVRELGVYSFTIAGNDFVSLAKGVDATYGGVLLNGIYHASRRADNPYGIVLYVDSYSHDSWAQLMSRNLGVAFYALDMTRDPSTGKVYGCVMNATRDGYALAELDYTSGSANYIGDFAGPLRALAADASGQLFGVGADGVLYKVSKEDARLTPVGDIGYIGSYISSATIDPRTGKMYWAISQSQASGIIEIDTETGESNVLCVFPYAEEITGLEIVVTDHDVPAAPQNVKATFAAGSKTGKVTFKMPATLANGEAANGEAGYVVKLNGTEVKTGTSTYGAEVSDDVTLEKGGFTTVSVSATNSAGTSSEAVWHAMHAGPLSLPYRNDIYNAARFSELIVIDADNDDRTWRFAANMRSAYCEYNSDRAKNDWLVLPGAYLEKDKTYTFSVDIRTQIAAGYQGSEAFEIKMANTCTASALKSGTTLVSYREFPNNDQFTTYSAVITPTTSGVYYIGVHACSSKDQFWIIADNIYLSDGYAAGVPTMPLNAAVTIEEGSNDAKITFKSPLGCFKAATTDPKMTHIDIVRNGEVIHSFINPPKATELEYIDPLPGYSDWSYSIIPYNEVGIGVAANLPVASIGMERPNIITSIEMHPNADHSALDISWTPVEKSWRGQPLNSKFINYRVLVHGYPEHLVLADNLTDTHYSVPIEQSDENEFVQYHVYPFTITGRSLCTSTPTYPVGPGERTDWEETFADGELHHPMSFDAANGQWIAATNANVGFNDADGNNGMLVYIAGAQNDVATMSTHRLSLKGKTYPIVSFNVYKFNGPKDDNGNEGENLNEFDLYVRDLDGEDDSWHNVYHTVISQLRTLGWNAISLPLDDYAGKNIQLQAAFKAVNIAGNAFDALKLVATTSGIDDIENQSVITVRTVAGGVQIRNAAGKSASVHTLDGRLVFTDTLASDHFIPLGRGFYIVTVGAKHEKVIVE